MCPSAPLPEEKVLFEGPELILCKVLYPGLAGSPGFYAHNENWEGKLAEKLTSMVRRGDDAAPMGDRKSVV